ncbi:uncharacterized protein L969DRAFT_95080 [Mixia osmundae IAM 14324]|uniref:Uncharacterized protein n=1 Tax=Mixia osmundae (strain CBS 9802 / IAM 14324 / JCM 22182 / KY 12970) TaxID=764103 RepID=G7E7E8_MIXOS|nr:uncharacterized protein L969DRAFT_95080 [Mixia osmundae IAM 14324]KEI38917.1 hypothetical protein L969DRAFT_95080 [Mixia osmundae IAM 14324]GAA98758.1 hypothetical protein E5Q_05446 [Mixia osmundae IAM 14324]
MTAQEIMFRVLAIFALFFSSSLAIVVPQRSTGLDKRSLTCALSITVEGFGSFGSQFSLTAVNGDVAAATQLPGVPGVGIVGVTTNDRLQRFQNQEWTLSQIRFASVVNGKDVAFNIVLLYQTPGDFKLFNLASITVGGVTPASSMLFRHTLDTRLGHDLLSQRIFFFLSDSTSKMCNFATSLYLLSFASLLSAWLIQGPPYHKMLESADSHPITVAYNLQYSFKYDCGHEQAFPEKVTHPSDASVSVKVVSSTVATKDVSVTIEKSHGKHASSEDTFAGTLVGFVNTKPPAIRVRVIERFPSPVVAYQSCCTGVFNATLDLAYRERSVIKTDSHFYLDCSSSASAHKGDACSKDHLKELGLSKIKHHCEGAQAVFSDDETES